MTNVARKQNEQLSNLGDEIRQLRKVRGVTLQQMADAIGKSVLNSGTSVCTVLAPEIGVAGGRERGDERHRPAGGTRRQ